MLTNFNRLSQVASIAALTVGVAFAAAPVQKAAAQALGAGSDSVSTLLRDGTAPAGTVRPVYDYANGFGGPFRYVVIGSGAGRTAFINGTTDFVFTDTIGTSFGAGTRVLNNTIVNSSNAPVIDPISGQPYVVIQEATIDVAFAYNVPGFSVNIDGTTACRIIRGNQSLGDPTNWSQVVNASGVRGPNLPIRRVAYGDNNGQTDIHQGPAGTVSGGFGSFFTDSTQTTRGTAGFVPLCNGLTRAYPGGPFLPPADSTFNSAVAGSQPIPSLNNSNFNASTNPFPSQVAVRVNNFNDGTAIPNRRGGDIIVNAASPTGNPPADPFGAAAASGDDSNSGSYNLGLLNAVRNTPGAIGYTETAIAVANGFVVGAPGLGLAVSNTGIPNLGPTATVAVGPTYGIFRSSYTNASVAGSAQLACFGAQLSSFEGNRAPGSDAGFNIDNRTFPYTVGINSPEAGLDTDNYGSYGRSQIANIANDEFGPCSRILQSGTGVTVITETFTGTVSGTTITRTSLVGAPRTTLAVGDTLNLTGANGVVVRATINSISGNTVNATVWLSNSSATPVAFDAAGNAIAYNFTLL